MLTMLRIRKRKSRSASASGAPLAELAVRTRRYTKGPIISEKYLSKKKPILIAGESGSNKTKTLARLFNSHEDLHGKKPAMRISAFDPITMWSDHPEFNDWLNTKYTDQKFPQWKKLELLPEWVLSKKVVMYFDDMHKLTGRKMHLVRRLLDASFQWYGTSSRINRIPPTLRIAIDTDRVQLIRLSTKNSYDATKALVFIMLVLMAAAGAWEAAIVLGIFSQLASGRNAARQD